MGPPSAPNRRRRRCKCDGWVPTRSPYCHRAHYIRKNNRGYTPDNDIIRIRKGETPDSGKCVGDPHSPGREITHLGRCIRRGLRFARGASIRPSRMVGEGYAISGRDLWEPRRPYRTCGAKSSAGGTVSFQKINEHTQVLDKNTN